MWSRKTIPPLTVECFNPSGSDKNEYLLISQNEAATIDVADTYENVAAAIKKDVVLKYIWITHAHPSHTQRLSLIKEKLGGTFCLHDRDYDLFKETVPYIEPDLLIKDEAAFKLGQVDFKPLHTPGHTKGSLCFWAPAANALFSGSTLLKGEYGKIWGPKSMSLMLYSLKRLNYSVYDKTIVYPGRGSSTTMGQEGWMNYLRSA